MHALQSRVTHESGDPLATNPDVQTQPQLGVHTWGAIVPRLRAWIWRICSVSAWSATVRCDSGRPAQAQ
jgi:hypothetical protein